MKNPPAIRTPYTMKPINSIFAAGLFTFTTLGPLQAADGVAMNDGKLMSVKDGVKTEVTGEITLTDGTRVTSTGGVTSADGKSWKLKDGDFIEMDRTILTQVVKDGVIRKDGKVMKIAAGVMSELSSEMTLSDGTKIMPDGKVVPRAGKTWELDNGDAILSDGRPLLEGSVIFMDGKPLLFEDCMAQPLMEEVSLDGVKVRPDGAVTKKDGGTATLNEGDVINKDGTWMPDRKAE